MCSNPDSNHPVITRLVLELTQIFCWLYVMCRLSKSEIICAINMIWLEILFRNMHNKWHQNKPAAEAADADPSPLKLHQQAKGLPPGRILYCKIPLVFHKRPTSNHRAGLIWRWAQLQSEASWFTALQEAALYTTTFSTDFQALEGRINSLWLVETNLRESCKVDNNRWRQSPKCK